MDALAELEELALSCGVPTTREDCPGEGGGVSPPVTEDGLEPWPGSGLTAAHRCVNQRCESYSTTCGAALCGNGSVDECRVSAGAQPVFEQQLDFPGGGREECDGDALNGQSCQTMGFAAGNLRCAEDSCILDTSDCATCGVSSDSIPECQNDENGRVEWFVAAATESEVAVLVHRGGEVRLSRFSPDLSELGHAVLPPPGDGPIGWGDGALARGVGGWVAVVTRINPPGYSLYTLLDGGDVGESARVSGGEYRDPFLIGRPDGAPLFVYGLPSFEGFGSTQVVPVADDLQSFGMARGLGGYPVTSGVWVGGGYLLANVIYGAVSLLRLDAELETVGEPVPHVTPLPVTELLLGSDGDTAYVLEHAGGMDSFAVRVDGSGAVFEPRMGYGVLESPSAPVPTAAGALVATAYAPNVDQNLGVRIIGSDFQSSWVESALIAAPAESPQLVRSGNEVILVFKNDQGLGLARYVAP